MAEEDLNTLSASLASLRAGSVIAAAGCGKTEQIALIVKAAEGRRLILTHTHAGVDAIRKRLNEHQIHATQYQIDTIGAWCLRYAASYPLRSGLTAIEPRTNADWRAIYAAAAKLIGCGAVDNILTASYVGVLVDEYQDCNDDQHAVIVAISKRLPTCVFGDHLQAIFDFNGQVPVDWEATVFPCFPKAVELTKPWRWHKAGNVDLANWLEATRNNLDNGKQLDFRSGPVLYKWLPDQAGPRQNAIIGACQAAMRLDGRLIVIADPTNLEGRAHIAKSLAKQGFSNIEPVDCKSLFSAAKKLDQANDDTRLVAAMNFLERCMSGVGKAEFLRAVEARLKGRRLGTAKFGDLIELGVRVGEDGGDQHVLELMEGFAHRTDTHLFRREMFFAMRSALMS